MPGKRNPGYMEMKRAAASIRQIMDRVQPPGEPILLVIESDIAKAMADDPAAAGFEASGGGH